VKISVYVIALLALGLFLGADGCGEEESAQEREEFQKKKETVDYLLKNQPGHPIDFSMDRYLLDQRLLRFNDPNKMSYLYVVLLDGTWLKTTIIGKLASTSKRLTRPVQEYDIYGNNNALGPAADEMGVYGESQPDKVGMTTLGSLIEIGGFSSFIYSETPITFTNLQKPIVELTIMATAEEKTQFLQELENLKKQVQQSQRSK